MHSCNHTHPPKPWAFLSEVNTHTYHPPNMHIQHCVWERERERERARARERKKVSQRDILQMLHVKEEESSTAIHPSPPSNTPLTMNERAKGVIRAGREVERKERWPTKKEKNTDREEEKKLYMLERDNYTTDMFTHQLIHWKNKIEKNVWFFIY